MLRIIGQRTTNNTRIFYDNTELRNVEYLEIHPMDAKDPDKAIRVTLVVTVPHVDITVDDANVIGLPVQAKTAAAPGPVAPAAPLPTVQRGKLPVRIELSPEEQALAVGAAGKAVIGA